MIINLIPDRKIAQFQTQEWTRLAINLSAALFVLLLILNIFAWSGAKSLGNHLKTALITPQSPLSMSVRETNARLSAIRHIQSETVKWSRWLTEINSITPGEIGFKTITLSRPASNIIIQGTAQTRDSLLNYQSKLKALKFIKNPQLPFGELLNKENVQFSISANLLFDVLNDQKIKP